MLNTVLRNISRKHEKLESWSDCDPDCLDYVSNRLLRITPLLPENINMGIFDSA